ncbi:MAG: dioxygenase [Nitrospinae bacterium]|nr:dioxygenase [Nitrospinota bacterium]
MPTLFVSHGAPTMAVGEGPGALQMRRAGTTLPRPTAILMVSAHWIAPAPTFATAPRPATLHDFRGFPRSLYELSYPAPGAPEVARLGADLLEAHGIASALDPERGFDHGVWSPLMLLYPGADIPVVCLSLAASLDPARHLAMGRALAPLRERGVMIVASGGATHNLGEVDPAGGTPPDWAVAFDRWLAERLEAGDVDGLVDWERSAPHAMTAHPTPEHFVPLLVAVGAAGDSFAAQRLVDAFEWGSLSLAAWRFEEPTMYP